MDDLSQLAARIGELDDGELEKAIRAAGEALGLDPRLTDRLARDRKTVRRKLSSAGEKDLRRVASMLKPGQVEALKRAVEESGNGRG